MKLLTAFKSACILLAVTLMTSCGKTTPEDINYIYDFHKQYTSTHQYPLVPDSAFMYVDYTTVTEMKAKIKFYWEIMKQVLADKVVGYYAIKGQDITREAGDVQELLSGVRNFENPDLPGALNKIVNGNTEAILITDGEMADPASPYMKEAFKTWLMKGHDIFIMSEPYFENGKVTAKKFLFYIIFYDAKMDNNFFDYIRKTARISHFPKISKLKISITPTVKGTHGGHSDPNSYVQAMVTRKGDLEVQEWSTEWEDKIEKFILGKTDSKGNESETGDVVIDGLQVDKTSIAGVKISGVNLKVFNVNGDYADYYNARKADEEIDSLIDWDEAENFMTLDKSAFDRNGTMKVFFDKKNFNPACLDGDPYNYFKISFYVSEMEENMERYREQLEFDDRLKSGCKNVSVFESVKQTISDKEITDYMAATPFYSIYVKSLKR